MTTKEQLTELYIQWSGAEPAAVEQLPGAGSNRAYFRMRDAAGTAVIGCAGTSREENHAFISLARHFAEKGLNVPRVLAVSSDEMYYLQQDLGLTSLFDALKGGREAGGHYDGHEKELLRRTIAWLPRLQFEGAEGLDFTVCYPQPQMDEMNVMFDLNYFKYCFLKATGTDFHELRLEHDFRQLAADLMDGQTGDAFLYRDFQARNVMLVKQEDRGNDAEPYFIDFQGGRRGPFYYDLASFLWQASARYPDELRAELTDVYYTEAQRYSDMPSRADFQRRLRLFVLFRLLQVLGAYGFRGYFERKQHFLQSIGPALSSLRDCLAADEADYSSRYPHLYDVLLRLTAHQKPAVNTVKQPVVENAQRASADDAQQPQLTVTVVSFSYKKGIPADESGNGGGYVFDCRATHNPGRYEQYKQLTGLDEPVIRFLEDDGEILTFLDSVYRLADAHVTRYLERGFTSLMFCFGCTGGQHRSVYSAEHLAQHIHNRFPQVVVRLRHREQGIERELSKRNLRS